MRTTGFPEVALNRLRTILAAPSSSVARVTAAGPSVRARFQPMFTPAGIEALTAESFKEFLLFSNNQHWSGLHRLGPAITGEMPKLKAALRELIDESVPVETRIDRLVPEGRARVKKLGKAVLTPILLITAPEKYGVWNGTSEGAMRELGLWPKDETRGKSVGQRYKRVNEILRQLSDELQIDLWTLDALWWGVLNSTELPENGEIQVFPDAVAEAGGVSDQRFGLEKQLHEFLIDNWDRTDLGKEWALCEEGGDVDGYGSERETSVGKIDLLARHKKEKRWLVIELKRDQSSDQTVGQILRYMGWVGEHLAGPGSLVEGLVIALNADHRLRYALKVAPAVKFRRYEVSFKLIE